jgi:ABC-type phosphate transport system auxiliary subunit
MYLADTVTWPEAVTFLGLVALIIFILGASAATWLEVRKTKVETGQAENVRLLISRYEQLAEKSLDAQQRIAADVSELHTRTASIEQILRTVDQ